MLEFQVLQFYSTKYFFCIWYS